MNSERASKQEAFWDATYRDDPQFFGTEESPFSHWSMHILRSYGSKELLEMGFGCGRDTAFLNQQGLKVTAVEISSVGCEAARQLLAGRKSVELHKEDSLLFLNSREDACYDAVYSNLFLNMQFNLEEHCAIFKEIARVLRPGGLHLFSVRSKSDPWYGKGVSVDIDTFDHNPAGTTLVYFSEERIREITPNQLRPLRIERKKEGGPDFQIAVLYVAQVRGE